MIVGNVTTGASQTAIRMPVQRGEDSVSRNIQNQIANAQKQMQELGENKEMSLEDKMKKRQEIQQQISDLQNQLRQHQIEQRKEAQQKKGTSMDDMLGGKQEARKNGKGGKGISSASMQAIISADASMDQVKVQGAVKSQMEGRAGVLKAEIKQDAGRGDVEKKKEELAEVEAKAQDIENAQMNTISDINYELKEARIADRNTEDNEENEKKSKADNKDKAENVSADNELSAVDVNEAHETLNSAEHYEPIDILSEGITVSTGNTSESGNNVDLKL